MHGRTWQSPRPYLDLMRDFVNHRIGASEFEERYLALFQETPGFFEDETVFRILDKLFADVDAYVADPRLRDSPEDLDDDQLHTRTKEALRQLQSRVEAT